MGIRGLSQLLEDHLGSLWTFTPSHQPAPAPSSDTTSPPTQEEQRTRASNYTDDNVPKEQNADAASTPIQRTLIIIDGNALAYWLLGRQRCQPQSACVRAAQLVVGDLPVAHEE